MKNKINVNISPNPLDLQTLHCSQNDTEERKFYFTLHNNGEVIDASDISDPIFEPFSVYKGGTEQLLPVNTDDPTTSPIIADIQYPDEEKTEQEFTYRESPTTIDGKALVEKIKGNTLVWNQLLNKSTYPSTQTINGITWTNNGDGSYTANGTASDNSTVILLNLTKIFILNHKYLILTGFSSVGSGTTFEFMIVRFKDGSNLNVYSDTIGKFTYTGGTGAVVQIVVRSGYTASNLVFRPQIFDLTAMFGAGNEPTTVDEFTSLFPLPYYQYDAGSLLSFNGTGIKTTGKNLLPNIKSVQNASTIVIGGSYTDYYIYLQGGMTYTITKDVTGSCSCYMRGQNQDTINLIPFGATKSASFVAPMTDMYRFWLYRGSGINESEINYFQLEIGSSATEYEPYTTQTTDLPISTFFPTGMKSAGNVYDELTNSKAITRVGEVDLGMLTWSLSNTSDAGAKRFASNAISDIKHALSNADIVPNMSVLGSAVSPSNTYNKVDGVSIGTGGNIFVYLDSYKTATAEQFKTAMDGVYLQYELVDEEATNFTQASLICEDGESTLYQDDDLLVCDCTEDFSKDSGFKDCKIKFTNDDGVVYSNKIQLHIERKP